MTTQKDFLEILENNLILREDGSLFINDKKASKILNEYLTGLATKNSNFLEVKGGSEPDGFMDGNFYCPNSPIKK